MLPLRFRKPAQERPELTDILEKNRKLAILLHSISIIHLYYIFYVFLHILFYLFAYTLKLINYIETDFVYELQVDI